MARFDTLKAQQEEEQANLSREIVEVTYNWSRMSLLDIVMHKPQKIFQQFRTMKNEYYTTATYIVAYGYAKELLQDIVKELGRMLEGIIFFKHMLQAIDDELQKKVTDRCPTDEVQSKWYIKKYNPEAVRNICRQFISNKEEMSSIAGIIRTRMVDNLGENGEHTFANLCDKINYKSAIGIVLNVCQENAWLDMKNAAKIDPLNKMLGVNILKNWNRN